MTPKFWLALALELNRADWLTDRRFDTPAHRREHRQALSDQLDEIFSTRHTASWLEQLTGKLPLSPVYDLAQALENPYVHALGMIQQVPHPAAPGLRLVASPVRLDGERMPARPCSTLGADTDELLAQAGYGDGDIHALREQGVI
jgi:crotonobetainyl-CoA:carnitine CoA-transferase CaiB-like acyl-CoA transferase